MRHPSIRRGAAIACAIGGLVAIAGAAYAATKVSTKSRTAALAADSATHVLSVKCPAGTLVTGGGISLSNPDDDYAQGSYPSGKRAWTVAGYRSSGFVDPSSYTASARCAGGARVITGKSATASLPNDGAAHSATARCPKGTEASGGGVRLSDNVDTEVSGSFPSGKRGWTAAGEYAGATGAVIATVRCIKGAKLVRRSKTAPLPVFATGSVTATCPKGTKPTGGGTQLSKPYEDYFQGSHPMGKRGWIAVGYGSSSPGSVTAHVNCIKR